MAELWRVVPNWLTVLRLVLAGAFFVVLNLYRYASDSPMWILPTAIGIFVLAAITDAFDGYFARRWKVESAFGRIMDPFCDKVLVLGALMYLAGPRFVDVARGETIFADILLGNMITGLYPWMVVVMLGRELLVTGIRGEMEGRGTAFAAVWAGKLKMILQSVIVPIILVIVFILDNWVSTDSALGFVITYIRNVLVYTTVLTTVISGIPYVIAAAKAMAVRE